MDLKFIIQRVITSFVCKRRYPVNSHLFYFGGLWEKCFLGGSAYFHWNTRSNNWDKLGAKLCGGQTMNQADFGHHLPFLLAPPIIPKFQLDWLAQNLVQTFMVPSVFRWIHHAVITMQCFWNTSITIGWTAMSFDTDIHIPHRMNYLVIPSVFN